MTLKEINQLVAQIETHIECWKQFNHFVNVARLKKFGAADESHFLEIKSIIVQEIELIFAHVEAASPTRDEIHGLIGSAPWHRDAMAQGLYFLACDPWPAQGQAERRGDEIVFRPQKIISPRALFPWFSR
jgi:hypothetical protein